VRAWVRRSLTGVMDTVLEYHGAEIEYEDAELFINSPLLDPSDKYGPGIITILPILNTDEVTVAHCLPDCECGEKLPS
jgi:hypothetical protein